MKPELLTRSFLVSAVGAADGKHLYFRDVSEERVFCGTLDIQIPPEFRCFSYVFLVPNTKPQEVALDVEG